MKKIIFFLTLVGILTSCKSTYTLPPPTNTEFTENTLKGILPSAESLKGIYVSVSEPAELFRDNLVENTLEQSGGALFLGKKLSGTSLIIPKKVYVRYDKGPKKGEPVVLKNGEHLMTDYLAEITGVITSDSTFLEKVIVLFESDSISGNFILERKPTGSGQVPKKVSRDGGFQPLKTKTLGRSSGKNLRVEDYRYAFDLMQYEEGMDLKPEYQVDPKTGLIYFESSPGNRYYITHDTAGVPWPIYQDDIFLYIDRCLIISILEDTKTKEVAESKKFGQ